MPDYLPGTDVLLRNWIENFLAIVANFTTQLGITEADLAPLDLERDRYDSALTDHLAKQGAARTATVAKNERRDEMIETLRPFVRRINNHPGMTNDLRAALGLTVQGGGSGGSSVGPEVPEVILDTRLGSVTVHFGTLPGNEQLNSKPSWAKGCNIYRKKTGEDEYTMIKFVRTSPYVDAITGPAADYSYVAQYQGTKPNDIGNQSPAVTIAASGQLAA